MRNGFFILFGVVSLILSGIADATQINFSLDPLIPPQGHGFQRFFDQKSTLDTFDFSSAGVIQDATISGTWSGRLFLKPHICLYLGDLKIADIHLAHTRGIQGIRDFVGQWKGWKTSHVWSYTFSAEEVAVLNEYIQDGAVDFRIAGKPLCWSKFMKFHLGEINLSVANFSEQMDSPDVEPPDSEVDPIEVEPNDSDDSVTVSPGFEEHINDTQVPEPVSLILVGSGLLGLGGLRRKFKSKST